MISTLSSGTASELSTQARTGGLPYRPNVLRRNIRSSGTYNRILSAFGWRGKIRLAVLNAARIALYGNIWITLKPIRLLWASLASKKRDAERMSRTSLEYEPPRIMRISQSPASIALPAVGAPS